MPSWPESAAELFSGSAQTALGFDTLEAVLRGEPLNWSDAEARADVVLSDFDLGALPSNSFGFSTLDGILQATAKVEGTLGSLTPEATIHLTKGALKAPGVPRLAKLEGEFRATRKTISIDKLTGTMGAGPIRLVGSLSGNDDEHEIWSLLKPALSANPVDPAAAKVARSRVDVDMHLVGENALLANTSDVRVRGNLDLGAKGTLQDLPVKGRVSITTGRYARRVSLLPNVAERGGAAAENVGVAMSLLPGELGKRIRFDVEVATDRDFQVRTYVFDADLLMDMRLRGTAALAHFEGSVSSTSGSVRFPGTSLLLQSAQASCQPDDPFNPGLAVKATTRRHGIRVDMTVAGTLQDPEVYLSSTPPYPGDELWILLTTGALPERLAAEGTRGQALLVGSYLANEFAGWFFGGESTEEKESFVDRLLFRNGP